ncbi:hypothetical protein NQ314_006947 [Rhamnusium bicolor]|uniref:Uncharacterized protein n=1 Tax=Rhamnusium bicolor TaxID=1586634 RepID=A0AAV8YWH0_9CUCU|nr:hypothetical protein NQ314_006947 [Rhamnusium bicolor]
MKREAGGDISATHSQRDPSFVPEDGFVDDISLVESSGELMETSEQEVSDDKDNLPLFFLQKNIKEKVTQKNILWKQKSMQLNEDQLRLNEDTKLAADICDLDSPYDFFTYIYRRTFLRELFKKQTYLLYRRSHRGPLSSQKLI